MSVSNGGDRVPALLSVRPGVVLSKSLYLNIFEVWGSYGIVRHSSNSSKFNFQRTG